MDEGKFNKWMYEVQLPRREAVGFYGALAILPNFATESMMVSTENGEVVHVDMHKMADRARIVKRVFQPPHDGPCSSISVRIFFF